MILTRSIRRKLVFGLGVVFAMVLVLSITGLAALYAYWTVVDTLRTTQKKDPRHHELARAVVGLLEPITEERGKPIDAHELRAVEEVLNKGESSTDPALRELTYSINLPLWEERWQKVKLEVTEFYDRMNSQLDSKTTSGVYHSFANDRLKRVYEQLRVLEDKCARIPHEPDRSRLAHSMLNDIKRLIETVNQIPVSGNPVDVTLNRTRKVVEPSLWLIGVTTTVEVILFFSLMYLGNRWVVIPVRQLHEAASRVANGDYSYRLKLRGKDEMVELGEMFNKMTERFQTDKAKLDHEVEVRSRQLIRNERMASIGFFASGVAHEINNPLQAIAAAAEALTGRLAEGSLGPGMPQGDRELLSTYLGMIERESTRCQQITARVLDFARGTNGPKTRQDMTKIVCEVLEMVSHMSKFDGYKIVFDRSVPHLADVNAAEMKQVILNLVANGLEAMTRQGTMKIQIEEVVDEVVISVKDDGCGMTAEVLENLYEPFFTEKQNGKGTGLGLSITHRIVGDHGGRIEASSEGPGHGSTFRVHLPRCAKASKSNAA